ncbi:MAG: amylo-alpha-1,6-glucosidase, partial [Candidatus Kryptoniota bacterium]
VAARNSIARKLFERVASLVSPLVIQTDRKKVQFIVTSGRSEMEARIAAIHAMRYFLQMEKERAYRMQKLLEDSFVQTGNREFDKALSWAKLSVDALITQQGMRGIWAGLPWFNNYWGRDSFISLPGAALMLGSFENARQILMDYAARQDTDSTSTNFGRIPNLIGPNVIIYNTADGTPWFVSAAFDYFTMTGDRSFASAVYLVIKRAFLGTVKFHMDSDYFLTHGDQETWMDAVGPDGPYTPRGNRAVEIQSLWLKQLLVTNYFAKYFGDYATAEKAIAMAKRLLKSFNEHFIDKSHQLLYDHISQSGIPDTSLRPNQLFALWMVDSKSVQWNVLKTIVEKLTFPWGVASLVQSDRNFHPYHHNEPTYVPDVAYHNGTVWLWLSGQLISYLTQFREQDFAFELTKMLSDELL